MLAQIADFLVNELLWSLSWGWYQLSLGLIFTWMFFVFVGRIKTFRAILLTVTSYSFAIITYFVLVAGLFINFFKWKYIAGQAVVLNPVQASLWLGVIYSILQGIFFVMIHQKFRHISYVRFFILCLISNVTSALIASFFIKL